MGGAFVSCLQKILSSSVSHVDDLSDRTSKEIRRIEGGVTKGSLVPGDGDCGDGQSVIISQNDTMGRVGRFIDNLSRGSEANGVVTDRDGVEDHSRSSEVEASAGRTGRNATKDVSSERQGTISVNRSSSSVSNDERGERSRSLA